jgi:hypothetical protein
MPERRFDVSGWRMDAAPDGWIWTDPHWDERVAKTSILALAIEALRRGTDLRDASAESGEGKGLTSRAVLLNSVLIALYNCALAERAGTLGLTVPTTSDTGAEIVQELMQAGILTSEEYRSSA